MIYSNSRLAAFENCQLQFFYNYIEKPDIEAKESIEAFMGSRVHETFEHMYKMLHHTREMTLEEMLDYYEKEWKKNFTKEIVINKKGLTHNHYYELGRKCITNYFKQYAPFEHDKTIALEKHIKIDMDGTGKYVVQGYIDRLASVGKGHYVINDYKTGASLPAQKYLDTDRQLALYSIAVLEDYPDAKQIDLQWHYVAFGMTVTSSRTKEQIEQLKKDIIKLIQRIENTTEYKPKRSGLCDYCSFQPICPEWKHVFQTQELDANRYKGEPGVKLADKYIELKNKLSEDEKKMELIKDALFDYAKNKNISRVMASDAELALREYDRTTLPSQDSPERALLIEKVKESGLWDNYSSLNPWTLKKDMDSGIFDVKFTKEIDKLLKKSKTKYVYVNKKSKEK